MCLLHVVLITLKTKKAQHSSSTWRSPSFGNFDEVKPKLLFSIGMLLAVYCLTPPMYGPSLKCRLW